MNASHPNPWLYGGILQRAKWQAGETRILRWDGREEPIRDGDLLLLLRTAAWVKTVGVERA